MNSYIFPSKICCTVQNRWSCAKKFLLMEGILSNVLSFSWTHLLVRNSVESSLFQVGHCILSSTALLFLCMCAGVVSLFGDQCCYGYFLVLETRVILLIVMDWVISSWWFAGAEATAKGIPDWDKGEDTESYKVFTGYTGCCWTAQVSSSQHHTSCYWGSWLCHICYFMLPGMMSQNHVAVTVVVTTLTVPYGESL